MEPRRGYRWLARVDALANRIHTSRHNPLYHSGAITVGLLGVLLVTGVYLLLFYRLGAPYTSVARLNEQALAGRWIRALHRFASDAALVAAGVHAVRMYVQRRTWGPRALAWVSGLVLVGVILVTGWTGYVLVWDTHAQLLAAEGARLLDALPLFTEPLSRSFSGDAEPPHAFFFVNLFAHIALPLSIALLLWVHVARVARPVLLPSRPVLWGSIAALTVAAVVWPLPMAAPADLLRVPSDVPLDWFFGFWVPITQRMPAGVVWFLGVAIAGALVAVPWLTRPRTVALPAPAVVDERTCTGCEQCVHDCPYDAIEMVSRQDDGRRSEFVARVKTDLCTSCGICVGSCPPMAISALGFSGRDQLADVRAFLATEKPAEDDVVIVGCSWSAAAGEAARSGARLFSVPCVGSLHSSTVETLIRGGAGGVLVVGCPEHDGRTREGVTWADARLFHGRMADLKDRVDRNRLRLVQANIGEGVELHAAVTAFRDQINALPGDDEEDVNIIALCQARQNDEPAEVS
ncbi:MAG TPA: cytochrome b N-terminal domain-containing protein [Longimicrobiales bacterium]|nr:cytochrome b N-terminal domain-containing protein [Longimicrobiales bacterium]